MNRAIIIGAGPAGLMAAEVLADAGVSVVVTDAKPSFGRKLLMAGKSGLNLTKDEPLSDFLSSYPVGSDWLEPYLQAFGPKDVQRWATDLGQDIFTGSSGRIFPTVMKASPLLRAWLERLSNKGVTFHHNWKWIGWRDNALCFDTPSGVVVENSNVAVFALGGASWKKLGSTGEWAQIFNENEIGTAPFQPSNMGFDVNWSNYMSPFFGQPVKALRLSAGGKNVSGEIVISKTGIEGGGIYALSSELRTGGHLTLDVCPDLSTDTLMSSLEKQSAKASRSTVLRKAFGLNKIKVALVNEFARFVTGADLVEAVKSLPITLTAPRPIDEAISTTGGVLSSELTHDLMLKKRPGTFCAGEMLDWDAPTGGYLITACLATGHVAGLGAARHLGHA